MSNQEHEAASIASRVISGELGLLEGCKQLASLSSKLVEEWHEDEDFSVFGAIASESDDLPTGSERQYWNKEALVREDRKISEYETLVRDQVIKACENIILRFQSLQ